MQTAEPREFGVLQPRDGAEQADLFSVLELGLEPDHVPKCAQLVVLAQLHHRMRPAPIRKFHSSIARIVEADRFHRPEAQGIEPAAGHDLDRHAAFEIGGVGLPLPELGLLARQQARVEGGVLRRVQRAVDVVLAALIPARGHPGDTHVDGIVVDDRGYGIEEGQAFCARCRADALGERSGGERACGNEGQSSLGQHIDPFARYCQARQSGQRRLDLGREHAAIHCQRRTRRNLRLGCRRHGQRTELAHLVVEQPDCVVGIVVGAKRVGAHQFGQAIALMRRSAVAATAHFREPHPHPAPGELPGRLASGKPAADDVNVVFHGLAAPSPCARKIPTPSLK